MWYSTKIELAHKNDAILYMKHLEGDLFAYHYNDWADKSEYAATYDHRRKLFRHQRSEWIPLETDYIEPFNRLALKILFNRELEEMLK